MSVITNANRWVLEEKKKAKVKKKYKIFCKQKYVFDIKLIENIFKKFTALTF